MTSTTAQSGYASVNGLNRYYEIHGGHPLVLLHGASSAIGSSFGALLTELARTRQVIALGQWFSNVHRLCAGSFAYVLEHTCFCAIEPRRRPNYADLVQGMLASARLSSRRHGGSAP